MDMNNIIIEYKCDISNKEYTNIFTGNKKIKKIIVNLILIIVGIGLLFYSYTLLMGILLIILALLLLFIPKKLPETLANNYEKLKYLHKPVLYKLYLEKVIIDGSCFFVELSWEYLTTWKTTDYWLLLNFSGFPSVFIPIDIINKSNEKETLMKIIKKYGKQL